MKTRQDPRPLVAHLVYGFRVGGLENGMVNLINRLPSSRYRHRIIALTDYDPAFLARIESDEVECIALHKQPGPGAKLFPRLYTLLRRLRPAILHTRNIAALEMTLPAWAAGVPVRIHGEHGWDADDPGGLRRKPRLVRRAYRPFVSHYIALSRETQAYLEQGVGVASARIALICNGVDAERFHPSADGRQALADSPFAEPGLRVLGSVGRLSAVKDQVNLIEAFAALVRNSGDTRLRLAIVGEGSLRGELEARARSAGVAHLLWLPGERADVPAVLRSFDVFVLPSLAEGISNSILEAMACGLPVVASAVGGNPELVVEGHTGLLVPPGDPAALAVALGRYQRDEGLRVTHGRAARARIEASFSLAAMVARYDALYQKLLQGCGLARTH